MSNLTDALIAAKLIGAQGGGSGGGSGSGIMHIHNVDAEYDETTGDEITPSHLSATYSEIASAIESDMLVYHDDYKGFVKNHSDYGGEYKVWVELPTSNTFAYVATAIIPFVSDQVDGYLVLDDYDSSPVYYFNSNCMENLILVSANAIDANAVECALSAGDGTLVVDVIIEYDIGAERLNLEMNYNVNVFSPAFYGEGTAADKDWIGGLLTQKLFGGWYDISGFSYSGNTLIMPNCLFKSLVDNFTTAHFTL